MNILLATFIYEPEIGGGAAVVVNQLANLLVKEHHEVVILTSWEGKQVKTELHKGFKIIRIPAFNLYRVSQKENQPSYKKVVWQLIDTWNPRVYRVCREIFVHETPDVVHVHKLRGISPSIWSAASAAGIKKIIHTCHDFELLSPEGLLMGRVGKLAQEQNLLMRPYQLIRRQISRKVHVATAPSHFVMDLHQKIGFFPEADIKIIPNSHGFALEDLQRNVSHRSKLVEMDMRLNFLFMGRLEKVKGIDLLCEAFSHALHKEHNIYLWIAGSGPLQESLREKYKHLKNIVFFGPVQGSQKDELFRSSHVLVAPSIAPESFGIVIAEAYCYGLPVIASKVGGYLEIVHEGETGFLVEPGSVEELTGSIERICLQKNNFVTMSENCFREAHKYTSEKLLSNYLNIYTEE